MKYVRGSEVSSFLRCRKAWKYSWIDQIEPRRPDGKLFFGNLAHKFIETYYNNLHNSYSLQPAERIAWNAMEQYFQETDTSHMEQTELDDLWELASGVMANYVNQWGEIDSKWTILATELRFAIPLDDDTMYEGTIDLVYLDEHEDLYFKDHKNVGSIERYVGMAEMDRQISRYWWALQQLARGNGYVWITELNEWLPVSKIDWSRPGYKGTKLKEPKGFTYNLILKDIPNVPEILKKGGLSKAKAQKTDYATYWQAMLDNDLISFDNEFDMPIYDDAYEDILAHLQAQETETGNRFFRRVPVVRSEAETQAAMQEFMAVAMDMETVEAVLKYPDENIDSNIAYRNINADCSWCNYKALCVAEMSGDSAEFIRNTLYRAKESTLIEREDDAE